MYRATIIYNKGSEEKLLPKKLLKLTHKAFDYISDEVQKNPDNFKQKLEPKELRKARIKNALKLQARNKKTRENNISKVKEAIATNKYYKADGKTLNISAIAISTGLSRITVSNILGI